MCARRGFFAIHHRHEVRSLENILQRLRCLPQWQSRSCPKQCELRQSPKRHAPSSRNSKLSRNHGSKVLQSPSGLLRVKLLACMWTHNDSPMPTNLASVFSMQLVTHNDSPMPTNLCPFDASPTKLGPCDGSFGATPTNLGPFVPTQQSWVLAMGPLVTTDKPGSL